MTYKLEKFDTTSDARRHISITTINIVMYKILLGTNMNLQKFTLIAKM